MKISNPLEKQVADALDAREIKWLHEDEAGNVARLDFYIPSSGVYVEVKQAYSPRCDAQLSRAENVILVQGIDAVRAFCDLLKKH